MPGCIHADLLRHGLIPDPFRRDSAETPVFLQSLTSLQPRNRYRFKQWKVPAEKLTLYQVTSGAGGKNDAGTPDSLSWINLANPPAKTIAENVVAMVIHPVNQQSASASATELTTDFVYDSRNNDSVAPAVYQRHQLPPEVDVIMEAIDEATVARAFNNSPTSTRLNAPRRYSPFPHTYVRRIFLSFLNISSEHSLGKR